MPPSSEDAPPGRSGAWLRALWGSDAAPQWKLAGDALPVLTGRAAGERVLHLPRGAGGPLALAAAAHAAAHWRFGGPAQPRAGLKPAQLALFAVLEDARVEALALRELPGLRALWLPFHAGEDAPAGNGFEALLARLARNLLEAAPADPHPWIAKARGMVFAPDGTLALGTADAVRDAASRLGNDIGQMRLPFNPATYRVHAAYRDDGSWLWLPEAGAPDSETTLQAPAAPEVQALPEAEPAQAGQPAACYPEWDARIGRYRADWCRVYMSEPASGPGDTLPLPAGRPPARHLARALAQLRGPEPRHAGRDAVGEELHAGALVEACVQRRAGRTPDDRVYHRREWPPRPLAVQLLLDASASTAGPGAGSRPLLPHLLPHLLAAALVCSEALEAAGHRSALLSFCSRTRLRVEVHALKHWSEPARAPAVLARCAAQRSGGSTRTGAALRHAARAAESFAADEGRQPMVLVLTDGDLHDVDAPDPAYLLGDLRRAVAEVQRRGVAVRCLQFGAARGPAAGWRQVHAAAPAGVPAALLSLLAA